MAEEPRDAVEAAEPAGAEEAKSAAEPAEDKEGPQMAEAGEVETEDQKPGNALAEKRGRMVVAGATLVVILCLIAVLVAGIFQLTSRWLVKCPEDMPVNDPARVLWQKVETPKLADQTLGVADAVLTETGLKKADATEK
jgi:hypothetical protein